jgi:putative tryptophan/tyrosine transport system substrate-binding protein
MKRQGFIRTVAIAVLYGLLVLPPAAHAQPAAKIQRVGILGNEDNPPWEGLRQGLRDLGYVEGRNITFEWRWSQGFPDRLPALARELVALKPDVIVVSGTQAARAAKDATKTVPIVMALSQHPERLGLVDSLARPGGNITGLSTIAPQLMAKKLELLKEVAPQISRVGVLWNPSSPAEHLQFRDLMNAASAVGVAIQSIEARDPDDLSAALADALSRRVQAVMVVGNPITFRGRHLIADFTRRNQLPSVFEEQLFVEAGGLMSYGPSFEDLFRRAAIYVDRILKGATPADLPVEQPIRFTLFINRKTATSLGLTFPPSVLLRADRVID